MYKNLISQIAEQEAIKRREQEKELANQKRIEKAKFDISNIYVGYISKFITGHYNGKSYLNQLTNYTPRMFRYTNDNCLQDIETEKVYSLLREKQIPLEDEAYVIEDCLQLFEVECIEALGEQSVELNAKLTKAQLRAILDKQCKLEEYRY